MGVFVVAVAVDGIQTVLLVLAEMVAVVMELFINQMVVALYLHQQQTQLHLQVQQVK